MFVGDSIDTALTFWGEKIFPVTVRQLYFWPAWQMFNFAFVPKEWQGVFVAFGAFFFNVFMSWITNNSKQEDVVARVTKTDEVVGEVERQQVKSASALTDEMDKGEKASSKR